MDKPASLSAARLLPRTEHAPTSLRYQRLSLQRAANQSSCQSEGFFSTLARRGSNMVSLASSLVGGSAMLLSYHVSRADKALSQLSFSHKPEVVCQSETDVQEPKIATLPRRWVAIGSAAAAAVATVSGGEAEAAKRMKAADEEKKSSRAAEEKSLSAYDAKVLATYRRKEAMKEAVQKQKAKGINMQQQQAEPRPLPAAPAAPVQAAAAAS